MVRKKAGNWGIFGIRREKVKDIRRKETLETLKRRKKEKQLAQKTEMAKAETSYYKAKAERKRAKKEAGFQFPVISTPSVKVRKKRQGRKLSSKSRIKLV